MKFLSDKKITFVLSIAIAALIAVLVIFFLNNKKVKSTSDIVAHTQDVLQNSDLVLLDVLNIETGTRGYLLTVNEIFLEPLIKAEITMRTDLSSLTTLTQDNPNQQVRIDSLKNLAEKRLFLAKNMIAEKRQKRLSELEIINNLEKGKIITDQIKATIAAIKAEEFGLLRNRKIENEKSNKNSNAIFFVLISFLLAIVALVALIIRNQKIRNNELEAFTSSQNSMSNYARSLIEASLDPLVTISASGKILDVNEASIKVTGVPREKLIGTDFSNYFTEPKKAQEGYLQVFEKGFVADYPLTIKHKNGNLTDVLYNASVYKDDNGNVLGVFAAARDVTAQKQSSQYARSLIEASLDPLVTISASGKILDVNEASIKVTGVSRENLIGTDFSNYFTEPKKAQEGYLQVFEKGFVADYPLTIKHKNGNLTDVLYNASLYKDDKGNVLGVFAAARDITAQKQSSQYARSLIEASLDPLVTISVEGKILDVNDASVKVTGVPREKLIGTDFSNYFTEPQKAQEGYQQVFEKGFVADYPLTIKHNNGNLTDVLYNASVYKDDKGNVLGVFAAARDITAQKQSSQYARSLIEASLDPLVTISASGKILDVNEASIKVTGVAREKLIDTDFSNYFTEPKKAQEGYLQVFEKGFVADYPLTIKHKNGNLTDVLYNASVYKDDKGNVLGVFAAARDVTEQKWAKDLRIANKELAFQNEEKEKRAAELGVANKELLFQNDEKEKRAAELGIANKKLVFENEEKEKRAAELVIANKELAFQNEEKEKRAAELGIANKELAFQNEEKEKRAAELVIANKELAFENDEKEKRAAELGVANKELAFQNEEKEKRADELSIANKELLAFTYISSHDLQEPLRKILTFVSIIAAKEDKNLTENGKHNFQRIQSAASRMQLLIDDLLAFSRIATTELKFEKTELSMIVDEVKAELKDTILEKQASIEANELCAANIIPFQFRQLMYNLVSNALKFSNPQKQSYIIITSKIEKGSTLDNEKLSSGKSYCHITIKDNGIGFEPHFSERIFGVFQKLHSKETYAGTGIGLAIVKKIVENHNGIITATSELKKGATFDIYIPTN